MDPGLFHSLKQDADGKDGSFLLKKYKCFKEVDMLQVVKMSWKIVKKLATLAYTAANKVIKLSEILLLESDYIRVYLALGGTW